MSGEEYFRSAADGTTQAVQEAVARRAGTGNITCAEALGILTGIQRALESMRGYFIHCGLPPETIESVLAADLKTSQAANLTASMMWSLGRKS